MTTKIWTPLTYKTTDNYGLLATISNKPQHIDYKECKTALDALLSASPVAAQIHRDSQSTDMSHSRYYVGTYVGPHHEQGKGWLIPDTIRPMPNRWEAMQSCRPGECVIRVSNMYWCQVVEYNQPDYPEHHPATIETARRLKKHNRSH